MDRRTALQLLIGVCMGAMDPEQKTTPITASNALAMSLNLPQSLLISLNWKSITVQRGTEAITIDQDELFAALKALR